MRESASARKPAPAGDRTALDDDDVDDDDPDARFSICLPIWRVACFSLIAMAASSIRP